MKMILLTKIKKEAMNITVGGKRFSPEYLGIKDGDLVKIDRGNYPVTGARLVKSSDDGETWEIVDCPENYGFPSISIVYINEKK